MSPLAGQDLSAACSAMLECYDRATLEQMLRDRFDLRLEWVVRNDNLTNQVAELFAFAARQRLTGRLLAAAADHPPPKAKLRPIADRYPPEPVDATRPIAELIRSAMDAFELVPALLADPAVRGRFDPFVIAYQQASTHIDLLHSYKSLHHTLHAIQLQYEAIANAVADAAEEKDTGSLNGYADELEDAATAGDSLVTTLPNPGPEQTWLRNLHRAAQQLNAAANGVGDASHRAAEDAIRQIERIIHRDPIRLHGLILREFETIPLPALIFSLRTLSDARLAPAVHDRVVAGQTDLEAIQLRLAHLVAEHTAWQNLDNSLRVALESWQALLAIERKRALERRRVVAMVVAGAARGHADEQGEDSQTIFAGQLLEDWPDVAAKFTELRNKIAAGRRLERLIAYADQLDTAASQRNFGVVFDAFQPFARQALRRFIEVDDELLKSADNLTRIGQPIKSVLEVLER